MPIAIKADDFKVIDNKMGNVRINSDLRLTGELRRAARRGRSRRLDRHGRSRPDPGAGRRLGLRDRSRPSTRRRPPDANAQPPQPSPFDALQMDVHVTVPNDLVVKASDLQAPGAPIEPRRAERYARRRSLRAARCRGDQVRLVGTVNTVRGTLRFPGPPLRHPARRHGAVRRARRARSDARHPHAARDPGGDGERERPRHAEEAGDRAEQHAAARAGRHPRR